jgi:CO/xanthine dehydrogenase Mo-binding subunit
MLRLDENQLRVVAPDVGGGFGAKFVMYPEEVTLAAACLLLRRPIKWIEDRREHFLAAVQERDQYWDLEVAFDDDGRLLAVRGQLIHDEGAYTPQGINLPYNASTALPGPYMLPAFQFDVRVVETNKVATMPVRGAGYPEGAFAMERLLDCIADKLQLDRAEVRRRNLVPPEKMPYVFPLKTRAGAPITLDSGDFPSYQRAALDAIETERAAAISASASATAPRGRAAARSNPASCASAARDASPSTPARCPWGKGSRPRLPKFAPSSSESRRTPSASLPATPRSFPMARAASPAVKPSPRVPRCISPPERCATRRSRLPPTCWR